MCFSFISCVTFNLKALDYQNSLECIWMFFTEYIYIRLLSYRFIVIDKINEKVI